MSLPKKQFLRASLLIVALLPIAARAQNASVTISEANFDRWMYPFNSAPGTRQTSPIFGAVGESSFDDRDGQFLVGFDTAAAGIPKVLPPNKYLVLDSVTVEATHFSGVFAYDPTFDDYRTYLPASDPEHLLDSDAGRPIELYGVGLRGGFTSLGFGPTIPGPPVFTEGDIYALGDPTATGIRNAFAADANLADVSNVIKQRDWSQVPWAVGTTSLSPGANVLQGVPGASAGSTFSFDIDLSRSDVADYLLSGLENGSLFFSVTSFHSASQSGGSSPNFYTRDNFDPAAIAPSLTINYRIIPEPSSYLLACLGLASASAMLLRIRRQRRTA